MPPVGSPPARAARTLSPGRSPMVSRPARWVGVSLPTCYRVGVPVAIRWPISGVRSPLVSRAGPAVGGLWNDVAPRWADDTG